jgi:uncharacterized iron-regulated protein
MNIRRIAALGLGLIVIAIGNFYAFGSLPPTAFASENTEATSLVREQRDFTSEQQAILRQLQTANVIYLGETHDRVADRQQQLAILQALFNYQPRLAIGMEMFQRPAQPILDRYLAGKITETELRTQSEFDTRWGFSWDDFVPLLRFAKTNRLQLIALNTPTEITRKVAKQGLDSLTAEERQYIPPITEIDRSNTTYRESILASYQQHLGNVPMASKTFDRFYTAQLLWDETMAERVANFVKQQPDTRVVVLAGRAHILYGYGIPDRVRRRLAQTKFTHKSVLLTDEDDKQPPAPADFIWNKDRSPE